MPAENGILPQTTLVILLGASEWPEAPDFKSSVAFTNSALKFKDYFINSFGLGKDNLLDLFDTQRSQVDIINDIRQFVNERVEAPYKKGTGAKDIIIYFTGHGGFEGTDSDYFLAVRQTTQESLISSAINIKSLAQTLKTTAASLRQLVILDACFASSALPAFQGGGFKEVATIKAKNAFSEPGIDSTQIIPENGTTLLCSSSPHVPSKIADDETFTMFSEGLLFVLNTGGRKARKFLTIADAGRLIWDYLSQAYKDKAPRPEVHSPNQANGDIAQMPYFPNRVYLDTEPGMSKFQPSDDAIQCCIILSETEEKSKRLSSAVSGMLLSYKTQILEAARKNNLQEQPYIIKVSEAFSSIEKYRDTVTALCRSSIAVFDVTSYEPAIMFFLGLRSVVRRGVTVASAGGDYVIGDTIEFPFNIKEVNIISHSAGQKKLKDPIDIMGERIVEGFRQLLLIPDYLDLPTFDAIRNIHIGTNQASRDWTEQVLLLCSFSKEYQGNNWIEDFKSYLPIFIKAAVRNNQNRELANNKPEIIRTLDLKTPRLVSQSLYEAIRLTDMCIVDWTEWKPNIFFELGIRVSANNNDPVCVIERKHKRFITTLAEKGKKPDLTEIPPGMDNINCSLLETASSQCVRLLEWFSPIEYSSSNDETGYDKGAFDNMISFYDKIRQAKTDLSQPISSIEKDSTYNIISEVIDWQVEASSRPVYKDLINSASLMNSPDSDTLGVSPVLYPKNPMMVQKADEGALERRIAAWLYINKRYTPEQIVTDKNLYNDYTILGNIIVRSLLNSENENDQALIQSVQEEKRKFKTPKKANK